MKTRLQFFKENIFISIIWNLPLIGLIFVPLQITEIDIYVIIGSCFVAFTALCLYSIEKWYNDYRFEELEKEINKLKEL